MEKYSPNRSNQSFDSHANLCYLTSNNPIFPNDTEPFGNGRLLFWVNHNNSNINQDFTAVWRTQILSQAQGPRLIHQVNPKNVCWQNTSKL